MPKASPSLTRPGVAAAGYQDRARVALKDLFLGQNARKSASGGNSIIMRKAALTLALAAALVAARVAPAFAAEPLAPGATAPGFTLKNQDGKDVKLSDYKGKIVVLQWLDPECPFV